MTANEIDHRKAGARALRDVSDRASRRSHRALRTLRLRRPSSDGGAASAPGVEGSKAAASARGAGNVEPWPIATRAESLRNASPSQSTGNFRRTGQTNQAARGLDRCAPHELACRAARCRVMLDERRRRQLPVKRECVSLSLMQANGLCVCELSGDFEYSAPDPGPFSNDSLRKATLRMT